MTDDEKVEVFVSTRKERRARRRAKRFEGWRRVAARQEAGWDRRLLRIWGSALILGFLLPLDHRGSFQFVWDRLDGAGATAIAWVVAPLVLGAVAVAIAAHPQPKVRGIVVLIGSLLVIVGPVVTLGPSTLARLPRQARGLVAIALIALIAPPVVAAANHALRRTREDRLCRALVGLGGLAMLLAFFLPIGPGDRPLVVSLFGDSGLLGPDNFLLMGWLLIVLMYAVVATLYLYARLDVRRFGGWLSMASRFALWAPALVLAGLLVIVVFSALLGGRVGGEFFEDLPVRLGLMARIYGPMILTAVGLALVLERSRPVGTVAAS